MSFNVISAKNDIIFKALFVRNENILRAFLSDILDIPQESMTGLIIKNSEIIPVRENGKLGRLDINLSTTDRNIDIEMQIEKEPDYKERVLFYWAKAYAEEIDQGDSYSSLNQTISISVLAYNLFDCKDYASVFEIREKDRHELLTDKMKLYFFELRKLEKALDVRDRKQLWLHLIDADSEEDFAMLRDTNEPIINEGINKIYELSEDEKLRQYLRAEQMAEYDYNSGMTHARNKGLAEGLAKGRVEGLAKGRAEGKAEGKAEGTNEMIGKMKQFGLSDEDIRKIINVKLK